MRRRTAALSLAAPLLGVILVACSSSQPSASSSPAGSLETGSPAPSSLPSAEGFTIASGTQATIAGIGIGAGNIWEEDYTTADGRAMHGLTAGLWFTPSGGLPTPGYRRVHPDESFEFASLRIHILEVLPRAVWLQVWTTP